MTQGEPVTRADRPSQEIEDLKQRLRQFAHVRSWECFHTAKNLTTAVAAEAGELAAVLQWATADQDVGAVLDQLEDEIADVLIYLVRLCDILDIEPLQAAYAKIERNERRFPVQTPASTVTAHAGRAPMY
jgi:NTP pyrophosphatase (non-canonical NTP hydrolase)